jgi:hypothetical protein
MCDLADGVHGEHSFRHETPWYTTHQKGRFSTSGLPKVTKGKHVETIQADKI